MTHGGRLPGGGAKRGNPGLKQTLEEDGGIFTREDKVEDAERGEEMNDEARYDGHHVETELLGGHCQVR